VYHHSPIDADGLRAISPAFRQLYRRCFAAPPWSETEADFAQLDQRLTAHLAEPAFHGMTTHHGTDLAGIVYGWPTPAVHWQSPLYTAINTTLPAHLRPAVQPPALEVVELMVHPDHQGQGLGRTLLDRFVHNHTHAWLATHVDAPARRLYEAAGWTELAPIESDNGVSMVLYGRERLSNPADQV
jgi:GNAT superfamily N-acetyltransferase